MPQRTYGGPLIDMTGAVDLHCHPYPDLFPRLADDFDIVRAARDAGMKAIVLKCHHENTVSRAYLVQRVMPGIRVYGGVVLNYYVGGINAAAVEAALRLGGKEVWMPTVDAGYHAQVHGGTGGYDAQAGGRTRAEGIWVTDGDGKLRAEVKEVLELVAQYGAILGTCHLSPREIVALVREARDAGVEKIVVTHPYYKVPNFDMDALVEVAKLGAMPEFGYCTVSPAWAYAPVERIAESIRRIGASRCLLVSDTGQRHNPLPSEALRIFAQTVFEKGIPQEDVQRMISANQLDLLDDEAARPGQIGFGGPGVSFDVEQLHRVVTDHLQHLIHRHPLLEDGLREDAQRLRRQRVVPLPGVGHEQAAGGSDPGNALRDLLWRGVLPGWRHGAVAELRHRAQPGCLLQGVQVDVRHPEIRVRDDDLLHAN